MVVVGLVIAVDVAIEEGGLAFDIESRKGKRRGLRNILLILVPPVDVAVVLKEVIDGEECAACAATVKYYIIVE